MNALTLGASSDGVKESANGPLRPRETGPGQGQQAMAVNARIITEEIAGVGRQIIRKEDSSCHRH
jgi:hypothetical protein